MMSFNEYRYELAIAEGSFVSKFEQDEKVSESQFTVLKYLKYVVYDWIKTLFGCELNWADCQKFDEAR